MPRRQNPRLLTPAGTISIGGVQTGIQCLAAPSGWHLLGRTPVEGVGLVSLKRGYDNWCGSIGGEYNVLEAVPRGKKLIFQAVVKTMDVTVRQNWPIVVRVVQLPFACSIWTE